MRLATTTLLGLIGLSLPSSALSQDLVAVAPQAAKVEFEDARLRVVRLRIPPNASLPMHDRPSRVVIPLTSNDVSLARADGTTTVRTPAGHVAWSEPARRAVTNLADSPLENVVVELKTARAPAEAAAHPPAPAPPEYLAEPRHRWLFENQYVRVYDVRIPPGETTEFHRHAYNAVFVFVTGGLVAAQVEGEPWGKAESVAPATVSFGAESREPYTHRVRNQGTAEYRVIVVQLLP